LFFDEPTTGLDPLMGDIINDLIVHCVEQTGATALTITHDMHSARKIADRIAMIYQGKIVWIGNTEEIDRVTDPLVDQFIHGRTDGPIQMAVRR
jgi:phospholipid/cholesterol/gamma-HCH transport system ATP-binding protein